jgi:hypothetical protein
MRLRSLNLLNLPKRVQALQEGRCESSGRYAITRQEGGSKDSKRAAGYLGQGRAQQVLE